LLFACLKNQLLQVTADNVDCSLRSTARPKPTGRLRRKGHPGSGFLNQSTAFIISSTTFFASPKTIIVLSI
jgi:hypothetical protein